MQDRRYREDDREVLTNEDIKADLKKEAVIMLIQGVLILLCMMVFVALLFFLPHVFSEYEAVLLWLFEILLSVVSLFGIYLGATGTVKAVIRLYTISHNRFFVTSDTLINKKEGRENSAIGDPANRYLRIQPNRYCFASGTYEVSVEAPHYRHSNKFAMNGMTLFRRSQCGDSFLLVSFKNGKLVKIYPEDLFDYKDSSPL